MGIGDCNGHDIGSRRARGQAGSGGPADSCDAGRHRCGACRCRHAGAAGRLFRHCADQVSLRGLSRQLRRDGLHRRCHCRRDRHVGGGATPNVPATKTAAGANATYSFTVNVRQPEGQPTGQGGTGNPGLDIRFAGTNPQVKAVSVKPATQPLVAYLAGDSTVCDQPVAPYTGWGQMITPAVRPGASVANYADSGEFGQLPEELGALPGAVVEGQGKRRGVHPVRAQRQADQRVGLPEQPHLHDHAGPCEGRRPGPGDPAGPPTVQRQPAHAHSTARQRPPSEPARRDALGRHGAERASDRSDHQEQDAGRVSRPVRLRTALPALISSTVSRTTPTSLNTARARWAGWCSKASASSACPWPDLR